MAREYKSSNLAILKGIWINLFDAEFKIKGVNMEKDLECNKDNWGFHSKGQLQHDQIA